MNFNKKLYNSIVENSCFVAKKETELFIYKLYDILFQIGDIQIATENQLDKELNSLKNDLSFILNSVMKSKSEIKKFVGHFFEEIPKIYILLKKDGDFIVESDPASNCLREVEIAYPGFFATAIHRFAHVFYEYKIPFLPRVLSEFAHTKTGIDIHSGANIGSPFMIDHGTGIVIGETTKIGNRVKIFQGVTLGALSVSFDKRNTKRHPTIEDDVVIYAGATILGGDTIIKKNSVIGGNVWLTESIDEEARVFHKSQIIVKGKKIKEEAINFVI